MMRSMEDPQALMAKLMDAATMARFWKRVGQCIHGVSCTDCCWEWKGYKAKTRGYYGIVTTYTTKHTGIQWKTHRVAWMYTHGAIPEGIYVLHTCDNPPCVNPAHLWLGTQADNIKDAMNKGRMAIGDASGSRLHPETRLRGEDNPAAKLTEDQVRSIHKARQQGLTHEAIADLVGTGRQNVSKILARQRWRHLIFDTSA